MTKLKTDNLGKFGDDIYHALIDCHEGLNETESQSLNARLILMLANEIGDSETLKEIFKEARSYNG